MVRKTQGSGRKTPSRRSARSQQEAEEEEGLFSTLLLVRCMAYFVCTQVYTYVYVGRWTRVYRFIYRAHSVVKMVLLVCICEGCTYTTHPLISNCVRASTYMRTCIRVSTCVLSSPVSMYASLLVEQTIPRPRTSLSK